MTYFLDELILGAALQQKSTFLKKDIAMFDQESLQCKKNNHKNLLSNLLKSADDSTFYSESIFPAKLFELELNSI